MAQWVGVFWIFYIMSIMMTILSSNWFLIWMGLEINMMSFIALIYVRSAISIEMSLKYFFIQSLGSGVLMMMFYYEFFWFDYISLSILAYKMGGGPFYFWFPSVCEGMSWGGCFLLMTVQKILPLLIISFMVSMFMWFIIISSLVLGVIGSMNQKSMKRLMAFSSIHHIGWILLGNFVTDIMWLIYLMMYMMMIMGVMMNLWKDKILDMGKLGNLSSKWSFVIGMLSMGGMPPLLGFYLKWLMFYNIMFIDISMLIFMIIMSVMMFYVYFRVVYMLIMGSTMMKSWEMKVEKNKILSLDMFFAMGVNLGVMFWVVML